MRPMPRTASTASIPAASPATAATRSSSRQAGESRPRRRPSTLRTVGGMGAPARPSAAPRPSRRAISRANSGLPPMWAETAAASSASSGGPPWRWTSAATSGAASPVSSRWWAAAANVGSAVASAEAPASLVRVGGQHEDGRPPQPTRHHAEQAQRRRVGPVEVVEDHAHGPLAGGRPQGGAHHLGQLDGRRLGIGLPPAERTPARQVDRPAHPVHPVCRQQVTHDLQPRPVRPGGALPTGAPADVDPARGPPGRPPPRTGGSF